MTDSPIGVLSRILARFRLWGAGYCTRHLIKKRRASDEYRRIMSEGTVSRLDVELTCNMLDIECPWAVCELCREEKLERDKQKLESALEEFKREVPR